MIEKAKEKRKKKKESKYWYKVLICNNCQSIV